MKKGILNSVVNKIRGVVVSVPTYGPGGMDKRNCS